MTATIHTLPTAWRLRWVDTRGRLRTTFVRADLEHVARISLAMRNPDLIEFLGTPRLVVRAA